MDQELKQYLDARFAQIDERFAQIDARFADVDRRAEAMEGRMKALIEKTETNLLGAFYGPANGDSRRWHYKDGHGLRRAPGIGRAPHF